MVACPTNDVVLCPTTTSGTSGMGRSGNTSSPTNTSGPQPARRGKPGTAIDTQDRRWATMPYYFLQSDEALQEFLNDFNKITKGLTVVDPVDLRGYTPGMPGDYPKPEGYRCQIEDGRRQNDHLKLWFSFKNVEAKCTAAERHSIAEAVLEDVAKKENKADALACLKKWLFESEETPKGLALRDIVPTVSVEKALESGESEEQQTNHDNASAQALRGPDSWNASSCDKPWTNGTNGECGAKNRGSAVK